MYSTTKSLKYWLNLIVKEQRRVICFGTGLMAEEALSYDEIRNTVAFFADNDSKKQGKRMKIGEGCYYVCSPEELVNSLKKNDLILITSGHYKAIRKQLEELISSLVCDSMNEGIGKSIDIVDFPIAKVAYDTDSEEFFEERILKECLREYSEVLNQYGISGDERKKLLSEKESYIRGNSSGEMRPLVIPRIMIMPTTRCNMRCKGCSSLLPLFEKPCDVSSEQILKDFEVFFSAIDECERITIGGEPFLYPELDKLLTYLLGQKKVLGIMMITNSTLLPKPEVVELLKDKKIHIGVSDYGHLEKMSRLIRVFEENDIDFTVFTDQQWTDMGGTECRGRSKEELRFQYLNCDQSRVIKGFHDGWFYTCARSARMTALDAYEPGEDRFKLDEKASPDEIRAKITNMFYRDTANSCNHCDLGVLPTKVIPAGIQLAPLANHKKSRYTIVDREEYEELKRLAKLK